MWWLYKLGKKLLNAHNLREKEYNFILKQLQPDVSVLDAGCGTGTFLERIMTSGEKKGIDLNNENVEYCVKRGLDVECASVLDLPFKDRSFDVVVCSHVMQVFGNNDAARMLSELIRVTDDEGLLVISTLNWFPRFFRHPENERPYPPDVFWRYFSRQEGATSPMYPHIPRCTIRKLWLRRPALIEFNSSTNFTLARVSAVLNSVQRALGLKKYWSFDSYTIVLKKCP
jgi:ubiquinone/menaquinone biosynthesis C-methylase UbiE